MNRLLALAVLVCSFATHAIAGTASGDTFVFSRDDRPVDGLLTEINLVKTTDGLFTATLHRAWVDMTTGKAGEESKVLGDTLACVIQASVVRCQKDDRPVDGELVELTLTADRQDRYSAVLHEAYVDMITGLSRENTTLLADGLCRQFAL